MHSVRSSVVILKNDGFFHRWFFPKCTFQFHERLNVVGHIDGLPFGQEIKQYASLSESQKTVPTTFLAEGTYSFGLLLFWRCGMMPFHALLLVCWVKMVKPAFISSRGTDQEVIIALGSMSLKQL